MNQRRCCENDSGYGPFSLRRWMIGNGCGTAMFCCCNSFCSSLARATDEAEEPRSGTGATPGAAPASCFMGRLPTSRIGRRGSQHRAHLLVRELVELAVEESDPFHHLLAAQAARDRLDEHFNRRTLEELAQGEVHLEDHADPRGELSGEQGVAAEIEEVVGDA